MDKVQIYVSIFESNQFQIEEHQCVSTRLIKKVNLNFIGSEQELSLSIIRQTTTRKTAKTKKKSIKINKKPLSQPLKP